MNRWLRRGLQAGGIVVVLAAAAVVTGDRLAGRRMHRHVELNVAPVAYREGADALARGRYLFASRGCAECHGTNGGGHVVVDDGHGMRIVAPNITGAGITARYQPVDWVRTIRHGVKPSGEPVIFMPSGDYSRLADDDLAAVVAYVRSLPPVSGGAAVLQLPLPMRVFYGFGLIPDAASQIDHRRPPEATVRPAVSREYGAYVAAMCIGCHGPHLSGGRIAGGAPDWPPAANLTPGEGGVLARYPTADALNAMFRSGHRPDGTAVKVMPFPSLRELSDDEVAALHLYLQSLPPRKTGA